MTLDTMAVNEVSTHLLSGDVGMLVEFKNLQSRENLLLATANMDNLNVVTRSFKFCVWKRWQGCFNRFSMQAVHDDVGHAVLDDKPPADHLHAVFFHWPGCIFNPVESD